MSDPEMTMVTAVAAQFGFWHFGRFAGEYRRLSGEAPSQTLRGKSRLIDSQGTSDRITAEILALHQTVDGTGELESSLLSAV